MNALAELPDQTDRSLLIVEDDRPFLDRLSRAMETRGFEPKPTRSGKGFLGVRLLTESSFAPYWNKP